MKKYIVSTAVSAILLSSLLPLPSLAGEWRHIPNTGYEYREIWTYQKDDGQPAKDEWLLINDIWYWFLPDGTLPSKAGYAPDGFCYNAKGEYIDLTAGCHFIDRAMARQIQVGMSYDEIVSLLGKEHEMVSSSQKTSGLMTFQYKTLKWYSKDLKYSLTINFTNDVSDDKTSS